LQYFFNFFIIRFDPSSDLPFEIFAVLCVTMHSKSLPLLPTNKEYILSLQVNRLIFISLFLFRCAIVQSWLIMPFDRRIRLIMPFDRRIRWILFNAAILIKICFHHLIASWLPTKHFSFIFSFSCQVTVFFYHPLFTLRSTFYTSIFYRKSFSIILQLLSYSCTWSHFTTSKVLFTFICFYYYIFKSCFNHISSDSSVVLSLNDMYALNTHQPYSYYITTSSMVVCRT
jgi:hypothetical protein